MAFIGNSLGNITTEIRTVDTMVGDGSTTTITLSKTPGSVNNVEVFFDGIFQTPGEDFTLAGSTLTFTTAPTTGINVVALSGNDSQVVFPEANSITTKKIQDGVIGASKINDVAVEKLSGTLPALDGSAVTGITHPDVVDVTTAASDPTRTTNKPVGSLAVNSTSGEMFICTDAETDNNTWMNIGVGTGGVAYVPFFYQGTQYGYSLGGHLDYNVIQKFSFTSDTNSVAIGNLLYSTYQAEGSQSATHGFYMRGYDWGSATTLRYEIQKFSFVSEGNAVDTGFTCFLKSAEYSQAHSSTSTDGNHCYIVGGFGTSGAVTSIQRFSFDISANTIDVGDLHEASSQGWGWSNGTYGYCAGGNNGGNQSTIFKFSFAAAGVTSTNVGALTVARRQCHGQGINSTTYGYVAGGEITGGNTPSNIIDRMSFASEGNAVDHGDLHTSVCYGAGNASSTTHGYVFGGMLADFNTINKIQKFAYASNSIASDSADLTATSNLKSVAGCQN